MAMEKQQFEDVSPIKKGDFPFFILVCREVYSNIWMCVCVSHALWHFRNILIHGHLALFRLQKNEANKVPFIKNQRTHSGHSRTPLIPYSTIIP